MPRLNKATLFHFRWTPNAGGGAINVNNFCYDPMGQHNYTYAQNQTGKSSLIFILLSPYMKQNIRFGTQRRQLDSYIENTRADSPALLAEEWIGDSDPQQRYLVLNWIYLISNQRGRDLKFSDRAEKYGAILSYKAGVLDNPVSDLGLLTGNNLDQAAPVGCADARVALASLPDGVTKVCGMLKLDNASPNTNNYFKELLAMHLSRDLFENVLMKVNSVEGGISEYFAGAKTSQQLLTSRLLPTVLENQREQLDQAKEMYAKLLKQSSVSKALVAKVDFLKKMMPAIDQLPMDAYSASYQSLQDAWQHRFDVIRTFREQQRTIEQRIRTLGQQLDDDEQLLNRVNYSISYCELEQAQANLQSIQLELDENRQAQERQKARLKEINRLRILDQLLLSYQALQEKQADLATARQRLDDAKNQLKGSKRQGRLNQYGSQLIDYYQKEVNDSQNRYADASQRFDKLNAQVNNAEKQQNNYQTALGVIKVQQANCKNELAQAQNAINVFNQQHQTTLHSFADYQAWNDQLSMHITDMENALKVKQQEFNDFRQRQDDLNQQISKLSGRLVQTKNDHESAQRAVDDFAKQKQARQSIIDKRGLSLSVYDGKNLHNQLQAIINNCRDQQNQLVIKKEMWQDQLNLLKSGTLTKLPDLIGQLFLEKHLPMPQPGLEFLQESTNATGLLEKCPILPFSFLVDSDTFEHLDQWLTQPLSEPLVFFNRDRLDEQLVFGTGSAKVIANFDRGLLNEDQKRQKIQRLEDQISRIQDEYDALALKTNKLVEEDAQVNKTINKITRDNEQRLLQQCNHTGQVVEKYRQQFAVSTKMIKTLKQDIASLDKEIKNCQQQLNAQKNLLQVGEGCARDLKTLTDSKKQLSELQQSEKDTQALLIEVKQQLVNLRSQQEAITDKKTQSAMLVQTAKKALDDFKALHSQDFGYVSDTPVIFSDILAKRAFQELLDKYQRPIQQQQEVFQDAQRACQEKQQIWDKEANKQPELAKEVAGKNFDVEAHKRQFNAIGENEADDLQARLNEASRQEGDLNRQQTDAKKRVEKCQNRVDSFGDGMILLDNKVIDQLKRQKQAIENRQAHEKQEKRDLTDRDQLFVLSLHDFKNLTLPETSRNLDFSDYSLKQLQDQWERSSQRLNKAKADFSKKNRHLVKQIQRLKEQANAYPYRTAEDIKKRFINALKIQWEDILEKTRIALLELTDHLEWFNHKNELANGIEQFHEWLENIINSKEIVAVNEQMNSLDDVVYQLVVGMYTGLDQLHKSSRIRTADGKSVCLFEFKQNKLVQRELELPNGQKQLLARIENVFDDRRNSFFNEAGDQNISDAEKDDLYRKSARTLITPDWLYNTFIGMDRFRVQYRQLDHVLKGDARLVNYEDSKASGAASQVIYFVLLAVILRYQLDNQSNLSMQAELLSGFNQTTVQIPLIVDNLAGKVADSKLYRAMLQYAEQMQIQFITLADQKDNTSVMAAFGSRFGFLRQVKMGNSGEVQLVFSWKDWRETENQQTVDFDLS